MQFSPFGVEITANHISRDEERGQRGRSRNRLQIANSFVQTDLCCRPTDPKPEDPREKKKHNEQRSKRSHSRYLSRQPSLRRRPNRELCGRRRPGYVPSLGASRERRRRYIKVKSSSQSRRPSLKPIVARLLTEGAKGGKEHLVYAGWQLHLHDLNSPLVDEAVGQAEAMDAGGVTIRVVTLGHLAAMAHAYGRMEDRYRVHECINKWHALEMRKFKAILRRHGLERAHKDWLKWEGRL